MQQEHDRVESDPPARMPRTQQGPTCLTGGMTIGGGRAHLHIAEHPTIPIRGSAASMALD
jgi:hypothetical protein